MRIHSDAENHRQRAARSVSAASQWQREAEVWFDGSVESVDRRLGLCQRLLTASMAKVADEGISGTEINKIADYEQSQGALEHLRRQLLTAAADREDPDHGRHRLEDGPFEEHASDGYFTTQRAEDKLSSQDRRYVELEATRFVASRPGIPVDELKIQARYHAELETSTLPASRSRDITAAFCQRVAQLHRAPRPRVASVPPAFTDAPDEFMFI
jgi:hypothetical protein